MAVLTCVPGVQGKKLEARSCSDLESMLAPSTWDPDSTDMHPDCGSAPVNEGSSHQQPCAAGCQEGWGATCSAGALATGWAR